MDAYVIDPRRRTVTRVLYKLRAPANPTEDFIAQSVAVCNEGVPPGEYHFAKHATGHAAVVGVYSVSASGLGRGVRSARMWARDDLEPGGNPGLSHGFRFANSTAFYDTALLVRTLRGGGSPPPPEPEWLQDATLSGRGTWSMADGDATRVCSFCSRAYEGGGTCGRCKSARYCCKDCQRKAWPAHKAQCREP